ncbi:hsp70-binding protein 1 [Anopheles maculipalpis]|uniref:hsp70-binding protein 1 n=1 Tax=Anopheles maculipalpis TaxID=1496333 RepID=UPI002159522F|nr:hsp70-binding protein 1 [Anopheles maculipalpis]
MASGDNPDQPRQPRNMQGLLKFAMEATKSEDAPHPAQLQPMDEERRRFLEEALKSLTVDVVRELEKAMNVLLNNESDEDAKAEAIDTVIDYVQDMDTANDFFKVGGFVIIKPGLESPSVDVRCGTLRLVGELAQNNPFCQKHLLELSILTKLTELLSDEPSVAQQAMHAISCMVRHYEPCLAAFIEIGGLECILGCIQTDDEKLRIRASFLMANLCTEYAPVRDEFIKLNAVERVLAGLQPARNYDAKLETALSTLNLLTESKEGIRRCRSSDSLKQKLETIVKLNGGKEECQEQLEYAQILLKRCYSGEQDGADR